VKRTIIVIALLLAAAWAGTAHAGLGVTVRGGYSRIGYGDFNDYVATANVSLAGVAEMEKINWIPEVSAEFSFPILPEFSGGIGIGYIKGTSKFGFSIGPDALTFAVSPLAWSERERTSPVAPGSSFSSTADCTRAYPN